MGIGFFTGLALAAFLGHYTHRYADRASAEYCRAGWHGASLFFFIFQCVALTDVITPPDWILGFSGGLLVTTFFMQSLYAAFKYKIMLATASLFAAMLLCFQWTTLQLPYSEHSFNSPLWQHAKPLKPDQLSTEWVSGLPVIQKTPEIPRAAANIKQRTTKQQALSTVLTWQRLATLTDYDSRMRTVLMGLREQQDHELSKMLADVNALSVTSTHMRRNALNPNQVSALLSDSAISLAYHDTLNETWRLLDMTETAFREKQADERLHTLLDLLADPEVDENNRILLIQWLITNLPDEVRLIRPLINLYDHLDVDYPVQKRLNRPFLELYLKKRNALLNGFAALGVASIQPLKDYRSQNISNLTYSQARMDHFIKQQFGVEIHAIYQAIPATGIPTLLNRDKYGKTTLLRGPSFKEDSLRRSLLQMDAENSAPEADAPVMEISPETALAIRQSLESGLSDEVDRWITHADPSIRGNVVWAISARKDPYLLPLLLELVHDVHPEVRRLAAIGLGGFRIRDTQAGNDPKFIEVVRLLQNYRANTDTFSRCWSVLGLISTGDQQKTLYVLDLILNDGVPAQTSLGLNSPIWRSDEERAAVTGLQETLLRTPEESLVKNSALKALMALKSPEVLGILLHAMHQTYVVAGYDPGLWRTLLPHFSLPQLAENSEDILIWLSQRSGSYSDASRSRFLKAFNVYLQQSYDQHRSGEYFQLLNLMRGFSPDYYQEYLHDRGGHIHFMLLTEFIKTLAPVFLVIWPFWLLLTLICSYRWLPRLGLVSIPEGQTGAYPYLANPAADARNVQKKGINPIQPIKDETHGPG